MNRVTHHLSEKEDKFMGAAKRAVQLTVILFLCSGLLSALPASADILGIVQTKHGSPLPGVSVSATSSIPAGKASTMTDDRGAFMLHSLPLGIYKLTFFLDGYKTMVRNNVFLGQEQTINLKIILTTRANEEAVAIVDPAALIDFTSTAWGKTMTREIFQSLPKGRDFDSLANIIPGISIENVLLGGTSVDGASGLENMYFIDGADTTNILDGSPGQNVSFDFIDEVQVKASGYQAECSGSLGGVINVVTRSGGNEFHGEVVGYYSGAPLRTGYRDILALDYDDDSKAVYYPYDVYYGVNDDHRFEGGVGLGGCILKDKLWFFGSILPVYYTNSRTLTHSDGVVKDWKRTENQKNFLLKLDARPLQNLRLSAGVVNLFRKYKGDLPSIANVPDPYISYEEYGFSYPNLAGSFSVDLTAGDRFMANARLGYFRTNQSNPLVQSGNVPYVYFRTEAPGGYFKTTPSGFPDIPPKYWYPPDGGYTGRTRPLLTGMEKNIAEKLSLGLDLSWFMDLGGQHSWKAGFDWTRRGEDVDNTPTVPILFFAWDRSFPSNFAYAGGDRGKYGYYAVRNNDVTGPYGDFYKAYGTTLSIYIQDSWIIAKRIALNFGVRAESEYIPSYATGNAEYESLKPIEFGLADKIAPRLGFVWDVNGDSSLKVFGSCGIFYDALKLEMAAGAFGGFKWKSTYYSLDTYKWDEIGVNGYFPGRPLLPYPYTIDFRVPSFDIVDPALKPMTQREVSLGLEKRLGYDLAFSLRFANKQLLQAIEDIGVWTSWGKKLYISNPGSDFIRAKYAEARAAGLMPDDAPDCPKAKRDYTAFAISLDKRFSGNWLGGLSYTLSRLWGNYSGLASGDTPDRGAPYTENYFDSWYVSRDLNLNESTGPLPGDRTHYLKAYGSYSFPFGVTTGIVLNAMSGTPTSTEWAMDYQGYCPFGRADQARAPFLWFANFYIEYNLKLGKNTLNINLNVDNVFDIKTAQRIYPIYNQGALAISEDRIAQGPWNINDYAPVLDPRYLMESDFYAPLTARLGFKFSF